jgi:hypothetical protein
MGNRRDVQDKYDFTPEQTRIRPIGMIDTSPLNASLLKMKH